MDQTTANTQSDTLANAEVSDQSQPQEQSIDFQTLIPEEYKEEKSLQNFSNMNDFVKSYLHSQKLVGVDKIPVPTKHATDDDWNAVYEKLGRPKTAGDYQYNLGEGSKVDENTIKAFSEEAHKLGLLPQQAEGILKYYNKVGEAADASNEARAETFRLESETELRKEYGPAYDLKISAAKNLASNTLGSDFLRNTILNDGSRLGDNPNVVRAFANLADKLSEDTIVQGDTPSAMTIKEIDNEIQQLTSEGSPYWNKTHINHKKAVEEVQQLYQLKERSTNG